MEAKLSRKMITSIGGVVIGIAALVVLYFMYLRPYVKVWREARSEIQKRRDRLGELRKGFENQRNPQDELRVLQQEIKGLTEANTVLTKIKTPGTETTDLPKELEDPDAAIRRELYRDYLKQAMEGVEDGMKKKLKDANIPPPNLKLYTELDNADEAAYYINRAAGLQGLVDALAKSASKGSNLSLSELTLEDYAVGKSHREGAVNVLSYSLKMTMDTHSLIAFLYNLQSEGSFYYIENIQLDPRGGGGAGGPPLDVKAKINTTMVFKSQVSNQVMAAGGGGTVSLDSVSSGLAGIFLAMTAEVQREKQKINEKKWYQFWKRTKKETKGNESNGK